MAARANQTESGSSPSTLGRLVRFAFVGGSGVPVNLLILAALVEWAGWHYLLAAAVSIEASTLWNYALNRAWTWRDRDRSLWSLLSYHGVVAVGLVVQWGAIGVGAGLLGIHYLVAACVGIALGTVWNFFANHRVTFQEYTPERRRKHLRVASYVGALILHLAVATLMMHDWDTFVFQRSVEDFVQRGVTPYDVGHQKPAYTYVGYGLPLQPLWYAYPPLPLLAMTATYWPLATGLVAAPWAGRLLIHLPFVLATFGFAAVAHRMVATADVQAEQRAVRLERLILFNPLFLLVAGVWGMFEGLMLLLLLASILFLRGERHVAGGTMFGLAALLKVFPLYLGPVVGIWILRRAGFRAAAKYFATAAAVFAFVSAPFFLMNPEGFLEQVFYMHADRPPAHYGIFSFLLYALRWVNLRNPGLLPPDAGIIDSLNLLSFTATAVVLVLLAIGSLRDPADERHLLFWSGLSMAGGILFTKIVSEQYSLLPLGLLAVALFHPGRLEHPARSVRLRSLVVGLTFGMTLAAVVNHVGLLLFVPEDVAVVLFGRPVPAVVADVAAFYGVGVAGLSHAVGLVVGIVLVPVLIVAVRLLGPELARSVGAVWEGVHRLVRAPHRHVGLGAVAALCVVLVLVPPLAVGVLAPRPDGAETDSTTLEPPLLLVRYRADWLNPTHRPTVPGGTWDAPAFTPEDGFYSITSHRMVEDLERLKDLGADAVVLRASPTGDTAAGVAGRVAEQQGLHHAIEIDLADVSTPERGLVLTTGSAQELGGLLDGPGLEYWERDAHLLDPVTGNPILFIRGAHLATNSTVPSSSDGTAVTLDASGGAGAALTPAGASDLASWWRTAFKSLPADVRLVVYADGRLDLPGDLEGVVEVRQLDALRQPVPALTVPCDPSQPDAFDAGWVQAIEAQVALVLVTWNGYDEGHVIEPTQEYGDLLDTRTAIWMAAYRELGTPGVPMAQAFLAGETRP